MPDPTLVVAIGAVALSALTAIAIARQVSEARKANALAAVIDLFREYRGVEMERARRLLASELAQVDTSNGMRGRQDRFHASFAADVDPDVASFTALLACLSGLLCQLWGAIRGLNAQTLAGRRMTATR